jgi:lipid-A-disaccharide synthase
VLVAAVHGKAYPAPGALELIVDRPGEVLAVATAALIKSGTMTLEAALAGVPHVVAYRATGSTYRIARALMTVDRISLVNLVAEREVVPELWRLPLTAAQLEAAVLPLLNDSTGAAQQQRTALAGVARSLGAPGAADRVAALVQEQLGL